MTKWFWPFTKSQPTNQTQSTEQSSINDNTAESHSHFTRSTDSNTPSNVAVRPPIQSSVEYNWHGHPVTITKEYTEQSNANTTAAPSSQSNKNAAYTTQSTEYMNTGVAQPIQSTVEYNWHGHPVTITKEYSQQSKLNTNSAPNNSTRSTQCTEYMNLHGNNWTGHPMTITNEYNNQNNTDKSIPQGSTVITDYNVENNTLNTVIEPPPTSWLVHWNNTTDPTKLSCKHAFDTLMYCFTPANQVRNIYRTGHTDSCINQFYDIHKCLQIKAEAIKSVDAAQLMLYESYKHRIKEINGIQQNHVWKYRKQIPEQFRYQDLPIDNES